MPRLIVGFDPSWGGVGWAIATEDGPLQAGHLVPRNKTYRLASLKAFLTWLDLQLVPHQLMLGAADPPPRCVFERPPWTSGQRPTRQQVMAATSAAGSGHFLASHYTRPDWLTPWAIPTRDDRPRPRQKPGQRPKPWRPKPGWREWWGITGAGRYEKKRAAIRHVRMLGWGDLIEKHADIDSKGDGARADVAEAILIAVGAAKHPDQAPASPRRWPTHGD